MTTPKTYATVGIVYTQDTHTDRYTLIDMTKEGIEAHIKQVGDSDGRGIHNHNIEVYDVTDIDLDTNNITDGTLIARADLPTHDADSDLWDTDSEDYDEEASYWDYADIQWV